MVTNAYIETWTHTQLALIQKYQESCGEDPGSVVLFQLDEEDVTVEEVSVFRDGVEHLELLRNILLPTKVSQWYVSNESP